MYYVVYEKKSRKIKKKPQKCTKNPGGGLCKITVHKCLGKITEKTSMSNIDLLMQICYIFNTERNYGTLVQFFQCLITDICVQHLSNTT